MSKARIAADYHQAPSLEKDAVMKKCLYLVAILALLLQPVLSFLPAASAQEGGDKPLAPTDQILYVRPGGSGTCTTSWSNACGLQTALGAAVSGDEIWVQAGTYKPTPGTDRTVSFALKSGVAIYGGFAGTETSREQRNWVANVTTLSGDIGVSVEPSDNSYHVVTGSEVDATAILDGFTISLGNANGPVPRNSGGGMYNQSSNPTLTNLSFSGNTAELGGGLFNNASSPTLTNVTFSGNTASRGGGGMYNYDNSNPGLADVTFSGNTGGDAGGGMYNFTNSSPILTSVTFSGNTASSGGGMYNVSNSPTLTNVTFSGNTASSGGGMHNRFSSTPMLANVTFSGNTASRGGGGMYNYNNSSPTLTNVTFNENTADHGGGMDNNYHNSPSLTNVTFSGNTASYGGGGMHNYDNSNPTLANVTFSGNTASYGGGGMYNDASSPTLTNATFSGNTAVLGGGMYNYDNSSPTLITVTFSASSGSGMYNNHSSPTLTNVNFSGNRAIYGGGIRNYNYSSPTLTNVTFSGNAAVLGGGIQNLDNSNPTLTNVTFSSNTADDNGGAMFNGGSNPSVANVILWGNSPDQIYNTESTPVVTYSDVQGGYTGTGNINANPQFVRVPSPGLDGTWGTSDDDYGDLHLQFTSPAIDAGNNAAVPPGVLTDLNGSPRFVDTPGVPDTGTGVPPIVDMGAYEAQILVYLPVLQK